MKEENNGQLVKFSIEVDPSENPSKKLDIFQHMLTFPNFFIIITLKVESFACRNFRDFANFLVVC